jgi:hypothetical protein
VLVEVVWEELIEVGVLDSDVALVVDARVVDELRGVVERTVGVLALLEAVDDVERLTEVELVLAVDEVVELTELLPVVDVVMDLVLPVVEVEEAGAGNSMIRLFTESASLMSPELSATMPEGKRGSLRNGSVG